MVDLAQRTGPDPDSLNTIRFETERVTVELPDGDDIDHLYHLAGGPDRDEVTATLVWDGPDERSETEEWVEACATRTFAEWGYHWVLRDRVGALTGRPGQALGAIGTRPLSSPGRVDVGYWLGRPYWGNGLMTEALTGLVEVIITELHCAKIEAHVFVDNTASRRLVERAGFEREGLIRRSTFKRGVWQDDLLYGLVVE